jgi:hypothetical protein
MIPIASRISIDIRCDIPFVPVRAFCILHLFLFFFVFLRVTLSVGLSGSNFSSADCVFWFEFHPCSAPSSSSISSFYPFFFSNWRRDLREFIHQKKRGGQLNVTRNWRISDEDEETMKIKGTQKHARKCQRVLNEKRRNEDREMNHNTKKERKENLEVVVPELSVH